MTVCPFCGYPIEPPYALTRDGKECTWCFGDYRMKNTDTGRRS